MKNISENHIDLTVTSPPYDNLRTYNGQEPFTFEKFQGIAQELFRITKKGGVVVWVVGDATIKGSETGTSFKQALYFKECGFNLHDTMIYQKPGSGMPNGRGDRYGQSFEYMFVLSKGIPKTANLYRFPKTGEVKTTTRRNRKGELVKGTWNVGNGLYPNIFKYARNGNIKDHPAIFPEKLAHDHIISWSNEGDLVFDPFLGSGTTGKMAKNLGRDFIGIELDKGYFEIAENRIEEA
jgi:site-specific DNA-methyltransferase (adenine-specific)